MTMPTTSRPDSRTQDGAAPDMTEYPRLYPTSAPTTGPMPCPGCPQFYLNTRAPNTRTQNVPARRDRVFST
jgi:hypothetical protein